MKTIEELLAAAFEKIRKIDVLDSVLSDCESECAENSEEKLNADRPANGAAVVTTV